LSTSVKQEQPQAHPTLTGALLPSPAPSRGPVSSPITIGGFHCPLSTTRGNTEAIQG
jgi:hypothetical protein